MVTPVNRPALLVAPLVLFAIACGGEPVDDLPPPFTPAEGTWTVESSTATVDGCGALGELGLGEGTLPGGQELELTLNAAQTGFTLTGGQALPGTTEAEPLTCSLLATREDFLCDPVEAEIPLDLGGLVELVPPGDLRDTLEALPGIGSLTFTIELEVDGTFATERSGSATTVLTADCDGILCLAFEGLGVGFPCSVTTDAMLVGPPEPEA
jgi:hypothetical protein